MEGMAPGQYLPMESAIHRLDPRAKFISAVFVMTTALISGWAGMGVTALCITAGIVLSRIPIGVLGMQLRSLRFIIIITFLFQIFFTPGEILYIAGPVQITVQGLAAGFDLLTRLILVIFTGIILTSTTSSFSLAAGMEILFKPLSRLGIPVHEIVMAITIAIRFVPVVFEEAGMIVNAQISRGAGFNGPGLARRARALVSMMVPLLAGALRRSDELATAMEARCYRGGIGRTRMKMLTITPGDIMCMLFSGFTLAVAVILRITLNL